MLLFEIFTLAELLFVVFMSSFELFIRSKLDDEDDTDDDDEEDE